ncbi:BTAD domain-containing putative transcriptional regulator [Streptomyces sp. NPDC005209]|uniref:AfsR/SARP family transcriptional regulator n=1 Tax=Streptomyces sp. NPDC005209 TaxID=3156715 RepID=UPI0033A37602
MNQNSPLRIALLGPVELRDDAGRTVDVAGPQRKAVLALLALELGRVVPVERFCELLWGEQPPEHTKPALQGHVAALRKSLAGLPLAITTHTSGYQLTGDPDTVDSRVFDALVHSAEGGAHVPDEHATARLRHALDLWRGRALDGLPDTPLRDSLAARLDESRLRACELWAEQAMRTADPLPTDVIGELTGFARRHPLRERLHELLMLALYRAGRQAEALTVYADVMHRLRDELGISPGPAIDELHQRILRADARLGGAPARYTALPAPSQLPADVLHYVGRRREIAHLTAALTTGATSCAVVGATTGMGGLGKSAFTIHVGHLVRGHFPDGQLYARLSGSQTTPAEPSNVLDTLLRALGAPTDAIPFALEERAALYRSLLAERRVLVVLDDARDTAQLQHLLPGSAGCATLVTSRNRLADLEAGIRVHLDVLSPDESRELLCGQIGEARMLAEPEAATALIQACGHLPLALRIVGARLATRPSWSLAAVVDQLTDEANFLNQLATPNLGVEASFRLGYDQLTPDEARAFRQLAHPDGPYMTARWAAVALEMPEAATRSVLERLVDLSLLESSAPYTYRYHDLLRAFARKVCQETDPEQVRSSVLRRLTGYFLATARNTYRIARPGHPIAEQLSATDSPGFPVESRRQANQLLNASIEPVLAVAEQASAVDGCLRLAVDLVLALDPLLEETHQWDRIIQPARKLLTEARVRGDERSQGRMGYMLGGALMQISRLGEAESVLSEAERAAEAAGDAVVHAETVICRGIAAAYQGDKETANAFYRRAVELGRTHRSRWTVANAQCSLMVNLHQDRPDDALVAGRAALEAFEELGDPLGRCAALRGLAIIARVQGRLDAALGLHAESHRLAESHNLPFMGIANRIAEAECRLALGQTPEAIDILEQAVADSRRLRASRLEAAAAKRIAQAQEQL